MDHPSTGLITFGDERPHEWEAVFRDLTEPRHLEVRRALGELTINLTAADWVARTKADVDEQVAALAAAGVSAFVAHVPCWTAPNLVVRAVQALGVPTVLLSNRSAATHGTVALLGAGGALDQIGYRHLRVREDRSPGNRRMLARFIRDYEKLDPIYIEMKDTDAMPWQYRWDCPMGQDLLRNRFPLRLPN